MEYPHQLLQSPTSFPPHAAQGRAREGRPGGEQITECVPGLSYSLQMQLVVPNPAVHPSSRNHYTSKSILDIVMQSVYCSADTSSQQHPHV